VRFFRSVEATVTSIAESDPAEAEAYQAFVDRAIPVVQTILPAIRGEPLLHDFVPRLASAGRALARESVGVLRDLAAPYDALLRRRLPSDLTRGPVAAFAAHAAVGPGVAGGSLFALWQAAYHLFGQWHAEGGAQALTDALVTRLRSLGGELRCAAPVERIETSRGRAPAVVVEGGDRIQTRALVAAVDPKLALLGLLDPPLAGRAGHDLARARRGNVVQALVHVAADHLPPYPESRPGDWNGLQSYVDRLDDLSHAWSASEAGRLPDPIPLYAFTTSAIDPTLAPAGAHTVYLACPAAPSVVDGGWGRRREEFVDRCLDVVESRAPGFRSGVRAAAAYTPEDMERTTGMPGGHPMHLDIALDQLGPRRPTRSLSSHRTPVAGLYISGAGTSPSGGVLGTPGKMAAAAVLEDLGAPGYS
jgi:phytoene dehydrogenase-like protein